MDRTLLLLVLALIASSEAPGQEETGAGGASSALAAARLSTRPVAEQQATLNDVWAEMARRGLTCTVLDAAPAVRVYADSQAVFREVASPTNDLGRTTIIKYDQMYFWASREYRELVYGISGVYHTYIEPRSGASVKVVDASLDFLGDNPANAAVQGFRFTATTALGLGSYIYWGSAATFDPHCTPERTP
ncbi:MAG: hypothetical protein OXG35_03845 [Acidobacteria bacterium]|nr:hypothetical protein [Acidobacteriota bacterium]